MLETPDGFTDVSDGRMAEVLPDGRILMDFLPADLASYAHEFDTSGRWVADRTYGAVWVPAVEPGWSPYSNGRWVWQADDYVWLSFDPWYAPFHFGRWRWRAATGWFWIVPRGTAHWSPGSVGWSVIGDEVSWVPLGHNEAYSGRGNYGSAAVNISRTTTVKVTNVYVNSRVTNGVVAVRKDNVLRGRIAHARIAPSRNPFAGGGGGGAAVLGKPPVQEIRPIRETRQPRPDLEIKRQALPPVRLEKASKSIRERVVAPTREKSAFKPGERPAPLKNLVKEKELEQWVAPRKVETQKTVVAPPPAKRLKKGEVAEKTAPTAVEARKVQRRAGLIPGAGIEITTSGNPEGGSQPGLAGAHRQPPNLDNTPALPENPPAPAQQPAGGLRMGSGCRLVKERVSGSDAVARS